MNLKHEHLKRLAEFLNQLEARMEKEEEHKCDDNCKSDISDDLERYGTAEAKREYIKFKLVEMLPLDVYLKFIMMANGFELLIGHMFLATMHGEDKKVNDIDKYLKKYWEATYNLATHITKALKKYRENNKDAE